jgi:hypothetical protein
MRNVNCIVLSAPDTASQNGIQIDSNQLVAASFQAVFGDTDAAGDIKIQMSNDICNDRYQASAFTVTNWTDVPSATASVTSGASVVISIPQMCYRWIRVVFTSSNAGATTIVVNMNALSL